MTSRLVRWVLGCLAVAGAIAAGGSALAQEVDCAKPIEPCTACHSAEATRPYARCLAEPWVAPASAKDLTSPVPATPKALATGKAFYEIYCDGCHGPAGDGKGRVAVKFSVPVVNIGAPVVQAQTDGQLFWKISTGRGAMPAWGQLLGEEDRWKLVMFVRTFAQHAAR